MITIQGSFADIHDNYINVIIEKQSEEDATYSINEDGCGIYFAGDEPVSIIQDVENEFQHILSKQCTINLICEDYMGDLFFADNARDVSVTVTKYVNTGHSMQRFTMFYGYLEPVTFSQGFAHKLETFTLTVNDILGTLEYQTFKDITLSTYAEAKQNAKNVSFQEMLFDILDGANLIWYDQSKGVESSRVASVFSDLGIFESYLLGETYEDLFTKQEVLDEIMRYLNLHILQEGSEFYIFDWDTMISGTSSNWINLKNGRTKARQAEFVSLTKDDYAGSDTNVTVAEVYNQIQVTDELEALDTIIESPLDSNSLKSFYRTPVRYMTEYIAEGEGDKAREAFEILYHEYYWQSTDFDGAKQINWYIQPMYNTNWKLNTSTGDINDLVEFDNSGHAINAYKLPLYANQNTCTPLIMKCANYEKKNTKDNSLMGELSYTPYLFISILGNDVDSSTNDFPGSTELQAINERGPIIEYLSNQSGGVFSPVDDTTNYIVFSGTMLLLGRYWECDHWLNLTSGEGEPSGHQFTTSFVVNPPGVYTYFPVFSDKMSDDSDNKNRRFYTRKFFRQENGEDIPLQRYQELPGGLTNKDMTKTITNLMLFPEDKGHRQLRYKYSSFGNTTDKIKKLPVLECELIIGDKRLVEYFTDDEIGESVFEWVDASTGKEYEYIDDNGQTQTTYIKTFTLGIDPKTDNDGDWIIGQEYELQNTANFITGTAIPVKKEDALSGQIKFKILGPVNLTYDEITRKNGNFWYWHTRWYSTSKSVLSHLESIIIKDFECKILVDGQNDISGDNDLVYVSDEVNNYISKADDIKFKFITQLSTEECYEKGVTPSINQNAVVNINQNLPVRSIYNAITGETGKPEEHYVDQYFRIFSTPKVTMETTLHDNDVNFEYQYESTGIDKESYVLAISRNLKMNTATVKLKSIE